MKIKFRSERRYPVSGRRKQKNFLTDPDYQPAAAGSDFQRRRRSAMKAPGRDAALSRVILPGTEKCAVLRRREKRTVRFLLI